MCKELANKKSVLAHFLFHLRDMQKFFGSFSFNFFQNHTFEMASSFSEVGQSFIEQSIEDNMLSQIAKGELSMMSPRILH